MGYTSRTEGSIKIDPPITAKELREHKELLSSRDREKDAFLQMRKYVELTDEGENVKLYSNEIVTHYPSESVKRYSLEDDLKAIVAAFPDRTYTGRIVVTGEDAEMWAYEIRDGKVKELHPKITWDDDETSENSP
jgi:hypothetical protein